VISNSTATTEKNTTQVNCSNKNNINTTITTQTSKGKKEQNKQILIAIAALIGAVLICVVAILIAIIFSTCYFANTIKMFHSTRLVQNSDEENIKVEVLKANSTNISRDEVIAENDMYDYL
jgi:lipopolysaccharide/colanic/teichoic acid biosynthesis glycosyltransferase